MDLNRTGAVEHTSPTAVHLSNSLSRPQASLGTIANGQAGDPHTGTQECFLGLQGAGVVGNDGEVLPGCTIEVPQLDEDVVKNVQDCLTTPYVIEGFDKVANCRSGYKTVEFTLHQMIAFLVSQLNINSGSLVEDIQIVGSAVPWLLGAFPAKVSGIKEHWNNSVQAKFAKPPNDLDIRIYLKDANAGTLDLITQMLIYFIASNVEEQYTDLDVNKLVKSQFLTKKYIQTETDSEGRVKCQILTFGFAPEGKRPVDIIIINALPRDYLWTQDSLRLSVKGFFMWLGDAHTSEESCKFVPMSVHAIAQAIIDRGLKKIRLDSDAGLDYISVLPLYFSGYLKDNTVVPSQVNLGEKLFVGFVKACFEFKITYENNISWIAQVLGREEVKNSDKKHIYLFAEALWRAVNAHHQSNPGAYVALGMMATRLLIKQQSEADMPLLWSEMARILRERKKGREVPEREYDPLEARKMYPEYSWICKNWDVILGASKSNEERNRIIGVLKAVFEGPEEQLFLTSIERLFVDSRKEPLDKKSLKAAILYTTHADQQVVLDHGDWQQMRNGLGPDQKRELDKDCFDRVISFRPDIACEILSEMINDQLPTHEIAIRLSAIVKETLKKEDVKRSWSRLKRVFKTVVERQSDKLILPQETHQMLFALIERTAQTRNYDREFVEDACKVVDAKQVKPEFVAAVIDHRMEQGTVSEAIALWHFGERLKFWKAPLSGADGDRIIKLALSAEFSAGQVQLYKHLEKYVPDSGFGSFVKLVNNFLITLKGRELQWTREESSALMVLLKTPLMMDFTCRKENVYFDLFYSGLVTDEMLNANRMVVLKENVDYVDAILCLGYLRRPAVDMERKKIIQRIDGLVKIMHRHNFVKEANELLRALHRHSKHAFKTQQDIEMLKDIIVEEKDFILFAQYSGVLQKLNHNKFWALEAQAITWMEAAPLSSWELAFSPILNNQEKNEILAAALWPYLTKFFLKDNSPFEAWAVIVQRAVESLGLKDRRKIYPFFDSIEAVSILHGNRFRKSLLGVLHTLFSLALTSQPPAPKETLTKMWKARIIVAQTLDVQFGKNPVWMDIDTHLAKELVSDATIEYQEILLPLLLEGTPTIEVTRMITKSMDVPGERTFLDVTAYLEKNPSADSGLLQLLRHKNIINILDEDPQKALVTLQSIYETILVRNNREICAPIITIVFKLIDKCQDQSKKEYWLLKLIQEFKDNTASIESIRNIVQENHNAIYDYIIKDEDADRGLYLLLQNMIANGSTEPLPSEQALKFMGALLAHASVMTLHADRKHFIQCVLGCMKNSLLNDAEDGALGLLLLRVLAMCLEVNVKKDGEKALDFISSLAPQKKLFTNPDTISHITVLLDKLDLHWNPLLNNLMLVVKDTSICQPCAVNRMKVLIEISLSKEKSFTSKDGLTLLLQNSQIIKKHHGKQYFRDKMISFVEMCGEALGPEIGSLFKECFLQINLPEKIWKKLFMVLQIRQDAEMSQKIASRAIKYASDHYSNEETRGSAFDVLRLTLQSLPKFTQNDVMQFLVSDTFLEVLFAVDTGALVNRMSCSKVLMRSVISALPNTLDDVLKKRWENFFLNTNTFLITTYPSLAKQDQVESKNYEDEINLFTVFLSYLAIGRWDSSVEFNAAITDPNALLQNIKGPYFLTMLNDFLPFVCDNLSLVRRKSVLFKFVNALAVSFEEEFDENVARSVDGIIRYYIKETEPVELFANGVGLVSLGTTPFVKIYAEAITVSQEQKQFMEMEDKYCEYLYILGNRVSPIHSESFFKAVQCINKKYPETEKNVTVVFLKRLHNMLLRQVTESNFPKQKMKSILEFTQLVQRCLKNQYRSVIKENSSPSGSGASKTKDKESVFDENCLQLATLNYSWVRILMKEQYRKETSSAANALAIAIDKLCPTTVEFLSRLAMCKVKLNWLKNPNNIDDHHKVYTELLAELDLIQLNIKSPRSIDFFLEILEEVCYLKIRDLPSKFTNTRGGAACGLLVGYLNATIFPESVEEDRTSLVQASMNNPLFLTRLVNDDKYEPMLFLYAHMIEFPFFSYNTFSVEHVWEKCEQIGARLAFNNSTCPEVVLDVLIPRGNRPKDLHPDFIDVKKRAFIKHGEKYEEIWKRLFQSVPSEYGEESEKSMILALGRLMDRQPIAHATRTTQDNEWHKIVVDVVTEGALCIARRRLSTSKIPPLELVLLYSACQDGYYEERPDVYFNAVFEISMLLVTLWQQWNDSSAVKERIKQCVALIPANKWDPGMAEKREEQLLTFLTAVSAKEGNKNFAESLLEYWKPPVGQEASGCFKRTYEELKEVWNQ